MSEEEDVIRMRGMPWSATPEEVIQFLSPAKVKGGKDGVHFTLSREGRPSGEAYVEMETKEDAKKALEKDHKNMGHRYIEVYTTKRNEMDWTLKRQYGGPNYQQDGCVRLRGLPFGCTKEEVANFFAGLEIVPNGINLVADYTGRATGEAYVQFANDDIAEKALKKHKECIGPRYIEIFRSNLSELKAAVGPKMRSPLAFPNRPAPYDTGNRFGGMNRFGERGGGMVGGGMPRGPMRPNMGGPPMRGGGGYSDYDNGWGPGGRDSSRMEPWGPGPRDRMEPYGMGPGPAGPGGPGPAGKDWDDDGPRGPGGKEHIVHMRGLPFRATEADIADFFKPLVPVFIDIDYEKSGRPSGKADVGFASHEEAAKAVARDKEQMGHRYIELFLDSTPERGNPRPGNMGRGLDDRDMGMPMNPAPNRSEYILLVPGDGSHSEDLQGRAQLVPGWAEQEWAVEDDYGMILPLTKGQVWVEVPVVTREEEEETEGMEAVSTIKSTHGPCRKGERIEEDVPGTKCCDALEFIVRFREGLEKSAEGREKIGPSEEDVDESRIDEDEVLHVSDGAGTPEPPGGRGMPFPVPIAGSGVEDLLTPACRRVISGPASRHRGTRVDTGAPKPHRTRLCGASVRIVVDPSRKPCLKIDGRSKAPRHAHVLDYSFERKTFAFRS
ncbi:unnamed protein product [Darwinula stevensoni]|uniref:RRM domain-containing protein n=1 Tax=Darwinula stevensoni TaxID=69355 RepID=A0A7R8XBJ0_9CRUS|nr:unnamed protein product [Darwinula stevensoni]CAG0887832.1 unnamed protein product [Darwinula stevensoni]